MSANQWQRGFVAGAITANIGWIIATLAYRTWFA